MTTWVAPAVALLLLVGCAANCPGTCDTSLTLGQDRIGTHRVALASTADAFVNGGRVARPAAKGGFGGGFNAIDAGLFDAGNGTPYTVTENVSLTLSHRSTTPLVGPWSSYGQVGVAVGENHFFLPSGMGVFTDPTTLQFSGVTIEPEIGLQRRWQGRGWAKEFALVGSAGVGVQATAVKTSVQSALLDVEHHSSHLTPYAAAGVELQNAKRFPYIGLAARVNQDGSVQLRSGLRVPLSRP